jgi:diacylglycerol kinase (ATP)
MKPAKTGITRLIDATGYSIRGLRACFAHEAAFRQEVAAFVVLFPLSFFIARTTVQWLLLVAPLFLLLIVELLNSAVESVVDRIGHEVHELSGRAKDMGSASVLLCLLLIGCCWGGVIWENFFRL